MPSAGFHFVDQCILGNYTWSCMGQKYTPVYKKMGKWYVAWVKEVSGVNTQGKTLKEAKGNLKDALRLMRDFL